MDWKQIILMAKGKADNPDYENDEQQLTWRARVLLENTIKPAIREVLEFLEENDIPFDKKRKHFIDDLSTAIGAEIFLGDDNCNVEIFIGLTKETIIGLLTEFRYVHIDRSNLLELPLNEAKITASEVKRLLAEDVRIYYEKLAEMSQLEANSF
ncbi:MAG: hypothetical protein AB1782_15525 [Cyanobacteriota bacterium]